MGQKMLKNSVKRGSNVPKTHFDPIFEPFLSLGAWGLLIAAGGLKRGAATESEQLWRFSIQPCVQPLHRE
eukprot:995588-Amphidinium_carterae.1